MNITDLKDSLTKMKVLNLKKPEYQVLGLFLSFVLLYFFVNVSNFLGEYFFVTDLAANDFQIMEILNGRIAYGPYSRFQFNHPGPVYFYFLAFAEKLFFFFDSAYARYVFFTYLLNSFCIGFVFYQLTKIFKSPWAAVFLWISSFFVWKSLGFGFLFETWTPFVMICPFLVFIFSVANLSERKWWYLPVFLFTGSFLFQINIMGAVPFGTGFLFIVFSVFKERKTNHWKVKDLKFPLLVSGLLLFVVWLPVLIDFFQNFPGNISSVLKYLLKGGGNKKPVEVFSFLKTMLDSIFPLPYAGFFYGLIILLPFWKPDGFNSFALRLRNFSFVYTVVILLTLFRMKGPIVPHLYWHFDSVIAVQIFLVLMVFFQKQIDVEWKPKQFVWFVLLIGFSVFLYGKEPAKDRNLSVKEWTNAIHNIDDQFVLHWDSNPKDFPQGNLVLGVASALNREGKKVCFTEPWLFLVPRTYHCSPENLKSYTFIQFETQELSTPVLVQEGNQILYLNSSVKIQKN
ncbi:hypothetical protein [Leptospira kanakyensis]|uniref:hypothetical protein n=1 Tax=Leptospira kanakyensis TaxID=2484968 RepID=UPI00223CD329|nr:hypothetical protein [Leptospira kanakyensis]MCW7482084.1 hypothetical protein [Leptospira kanakyensis]